MDYLLEWENIPLKNGQPGKRWREFIIYYSKINCCDLCGKLGNIRKVNFRSGVFGWNFTGRKDYVTESKDMLCMGCWNKIRPLFYREQEINELRILINRLQRTISNEWKQNNQDHRRTAGLPGDDDGGS